MSLKKKIGVAAGALLIAGGLLTSAAFANTAPETATQPGTRATAKASSLSDAAKEVLQQLHDLRKSVMGKFQTDSKALVDKAVTDGKITQAEADKMLKFSAGRGGRGDHGKGFGGAKGGPRGGMRGGMRGGFHGDFQSKLDAAVKDGTITQEQANKLLEQLGPKAPKANQ